MDIFLIGTLILLALFLGYLLGRMVKSSELKQAKNLAVKWSRGSIMGELYEKVLPALPWFPYAPKDMVFVGKWVDYIIFDGLSEGNLKKIIFLELKWGSSTLNKNERMIRNVLQEKRVQYSEYRIASHNT